MQNEREFISELSKPTQRKNKFFTKFNITSSLSKLEDYFSIRNSLQFYLAHEEQIREEEFCFKDELFKWDPSKDKLIITLPNHLKDLRFVGNDYYRIDDKLDAAGSLSGKKLTLIKRTTLKELYPTAKKYLKDLSLIHI